MNYTLYNAVYDIMIFQIPASFLITIAFVLHYLNTPGVFTVIRSSRLYACTIIPLTFLMFWVFTCAIMTTVDLLVFPALFALIRFSEALMYEK